MRHFFYSDIQYVEYLDYRLATQNMHPGGFLETTFFFF